jgi:small subunit ribosomal protein S2
MVNELVKQLLEAGVHFGHQTRRWNPKMKKFIFGERSGIYIIDLEKTADCLNAARDFIRDIAAKGGKVLFVGTKKQAQMIVEEEAKKCGMYYLNYRWLGGLLTNFQTVKKSIARLNEIEELSKSEVWANFTKKEVSSMTKERDKLLHVLGGIREMTELPAVVFIVDPHKEAIAVHESSKLGLPIIAIIDTNCDPDAITFPIPGNDDALKSIKLIASLLTESILEGRREYDTNRAIKQKEAVAEAAAPSKPEAPAAQA